MPATELPIIAMGLESPLSLRGGVSVLVETLIDGLAKDFRIILISPDKFGGAGGSLPASISSHIHWNPETVSPRQSRELVDDIKRAGVSLVHLHIAGNYGWGIRFPGFSPLPHLRRAKIPVLTTVHSVVSILDGYCGRLKPLWFKLALLPVAWLGKMRALASVHCEIAASRHDADNLKRWYWPLRNRFETIYHSRLSLEDRVGDSGARENLILNVGHIALRKGQHILAEAFARVAARYPAWKLQLVGPELELECGDLIRETARRNGLEDRIELAGSRSDVYRLMRRAAVYVQPSLEEALGLALQEALFFDCACVGADVGGIPELIDHEANGLLCKAGNVDSLATQLDLLMGDGDLRSKLGRQAGESIIRKGMLTGQMIQRHLALYREVIES